MNKKALIMASAITLSPLYSTSAQETYRPPVTQERMITTVVVHANGTHEQTLENLVRIETELGVNEHGEQILSFNSSLETLEVLQAETITPKGERIAVEPNAIRTVEHELSGGAPMFSDMKNKVVIYPKVQVGSRIYLKARTFQHTPHFGNQFFLHDVFSPHERHEHAEYRILVHPDVVLKISAQGMRGGPIPAGDDPVSQAHPGYRHYRYTYSQTEAHPREPGQVHHSYFASHMMLTTFTDYLELGKSYEAYAKPKVRVTPEVAALADEITSGIADHNAMIQALYEWVTRNIRYVAIYLGDGGFEPHDVATILKNRYGDCKDHVVLLQSLLLAKEIESSPALINSGTGESLSPVAVTFPLNHVILYVPSINLYLDPTAQFSPYGTLARSILNKPVVLTGLGRIDRTPQMRAEEHQVKSDVKIAVLLDGRLRGTSNTAFVGSAEAEARWQHFDREGRSPELMVRGILARFNEMGFGTIQDTNPSDLSTAYRLTARFELDAPVNIPGPSAMMIPVGLSAGRISSKAFTKPIANRRFPANCSSETIDELIEIQFPLSIRVTRIPKGIQYNSTTVSYTSAFQLTAREDGQLLTVKRSLRTQYSTGVCPPVEANQWQDFHTVLYRDIRQQIFIE